MITKDELLALATNDFQHRNGKYPKANIPDSIEIWETERIHTNDAGEPCPEFGIQASFKNTTQDAAERWLEKWCKQNDIPIRAVESWQDGDYHDDWVCACTATCLEKVPDQEREELLPFE